MLVCSLQPPHFNRAFLRASTKPGVTRNPFVQMGREADPTADIPRLHRIPAQAGENIVQRRTSGIISR